MAFYTIRPKSGTKTQWNTANPVLREREIGFEYPDGGLGTGEVKMKMGDGATAWNDLEYAILPLYIRDGQGNAVYDLPITPQPNLLLNADFKNEIINQRRNSTYTANNQSRYTIDMWKIAYGTLTVNDGYITYTNTDSSSHALDQPLDIKSDINSKFTFYANIKNITATEVGVIFLDEEQETISEQELSVGENIVSVTGAVKYVRFYATGGTLEIYQCKLETGSVFTGMPVWVSPLETLKCQRYYFRLGGGWTNQWPVHSSQSGHGIAIQTPIPMAKTPSLVANDGSSNLGNVTVSGNSNSTATVLLSGYSIDKIDPFVLITVPLGSSNQIGYGSAIFNGSLALSAEL